MGNPREAEPQPMRMTRRGFLFRVGLILVPPVIVGTGSTSCSHPPDNQAVIDAAVQDTVTAKLSQKNAQTPTPTDLKKAITTVPEKSPPTSNPETPKIINFESPLGYRVILPKSWQHSPGRGPKEDFFVNPDTSTILSISYSTPDSNFNFSNLREYMQDYANQARGAWVVNLIETKVDNQNALRISARRPPKTYKNEWDLTEFYERDGNLWIIDMKNYADIIQKDLPVLEEVITSFKLIS